MNDMMEPSAHVVARKRKKVIEKVIKKVIK